VNISAFHVAILCSGVVSHTPAAEGCRAWPMLVM